MALCDQLEAQTESSLDAHQTLVTVLLDTLVNSQNAEELAENWMRISGHFDTLFTTEHSIDQLKQTVLQLAVMGKLVEQNPNDEPASVLLERIAAEKEELVKQKKIKKQKPLPPIAEDEKPFELPRGWEWCRLGNISILKGGFAYKSTMFVKGGNAQVIRMGNIRPDMFRFEANPVFIPQELAEKTFEYEIFSSDILLTMTGTNGKRDYLYSLVVSERDMGNKRLFLNQRLCLSRMINVDSHYTNITLKDARLLDAVFSKSTGTANQANIGIDAILNWVLPVPPHKQQHRIVAKVDELMAICDQLKARLSDAQTTQLNLADALVKEAL
jgi:type I restriction enzyme S subunit